jgi:hypothetical protein
MLPRRKTQIKQYKMKIDLSEEEANMVQYLKKEYGITYGAELMRVLIKEAYDRTKGPYSLYIACLGFVFDNYEHFFRVYYNMGLLDKFASKKLISIL